VRLVPAIGRHALTWAIGLAGCVAYLAVAPATPDLAAHVFRADLFRLHGLSLYDTSWYAGHGLVGYSVLAPPLEGFLGPRVTGVLATVASIVLFERLVGRRVRPDLCTPLFALTALTNLFAGRMPFAVGMAFGLAALVAVRSWGFRAIPVAVACSLSSPLAGAFLAVSCLAWGITSRRGDVLATGAAAAVALGIVQALFPEGGTFPYSLPSLLITIAVCTVLAIGAGSRGGVVRVGALLYGAAAVAAWAIPSSLGGNITRFGAIFAVPALVYAAWPRRRALVAVAVPLLFVWTLIPVGSDLSAASEASAAPGYYTGLLAFLDRHDAHLGRVEIPFTRAHWETAFVAPHAPLARGWERQTDRLDNPIFYARGGALGTRAYVAWLRDNAVRYVALANEPLDRSASAEAALLRRGIAALRPVWHDAHWRVWEVLRAPPMVSGAARLTALDPSSFTVRALRPGGALVRLHYTPYWSLPRGAGCVSATPDGWTRLALRRPGIVTVSARVSLGGFLGDRMRCF
jgi:hypothetical protein